MNSEEQGGAHETAALLRPSPFPRVERALERVFQLIGEAHRNGSLSEDERTELSTARDELAAGARRIEAIVHRRRQGRATA